LNSPLAWSILSNINAKKKRSFTQLFSSAGPDALDLLRKCLTFNPEKRISVEEALQHKYVEQFHCKEDEVTCDKIIKIPINDNTK